jgi:hypothetical protein
MLIGSSTITASLLIRKVEAASIQWPFQPGSAQLREDVVGVVAALRRDDDAAALQLLDVVGVVQSGFVARYRRRVAAGIAGTEEDRLDQVEVALGLHPVEQHGADHAAPTDKSCEFHSHAP